MSRDNTATSGAKWNLTHCPCQAIALPAELWPRMLCCRVTPGGRESQPTAAIGCVASGGEVTRHPLVGDSLAYHGQIDRTCSPTRGSGQNIAATDIGTDVHVDLAARLWLDRA